jgi:hypothetical protein
MFEPTQPSAVAGPQTTFASSFKSRARADQWASTRSGVRVAKAKEKSQPDAPPQIHEDERVEPDLLVERVDEDRDRPDIAPRPTLGLVQR